MSKKEYMHEWLKADAVCYDLPSEEIIQQLVNDNETLKQQRDDLLEACKRAHQRLLELGQRENMDTLKRLKAAITKCEA